MQIRAKWLHIETMLAQTTTLNLVHVCHFRCLQLAKGFLLYELWFYINRNISIENLVDMVCSAFKTVWKPEQMLSTGRMDHSAMNNRKRKHVRNVNLNWLILVEYMTGLVWTRITERNESSSHQIMCNDDAMNTDKKVSPACSMI